MTPAAIIAGTTSEPHALADRRGPWACSVLVMTKERPTAVGKIRPGQVLVILQRGFSPIVTDKGSGEIMIDTRPLGQEWNWPIVVCFIQKKHRQAWESLDAPTAARMIDRCINDPRARAAQDPRP